MYSVVLMAALTTTTADAPSWGWRGCHGCWGGRSGCYGCNGGCYGGARSWGCRGCNGGCYGGGCHGGCHGGVYYGGCLGGCNGGCYGIACHGGHGAAGTPAAPPAGKPPEKIMKPADKGSAPPAKESSAAKGAKMIVDLPADAKLFIDDQPMKVATQHPIFVTPELQVGKTYYYELRAEVVRDGKVASDSKRVIFHAGDELRESFASLGAVTAEKVAVTTPK